MNKSPKTSLSPVFQPPPAKPSQGKHEAAKPYWNIPFVPSFP
ncbi:hypothetical protein [Bacteroides uniformis]